jgi:FtsZ-binding cell division protein ZapB
MTTMSIDILNNDALRLLQDMEYLRLIRMRAETDESKTKRQSLSERYAGALHLSDEQYEEFQAALKKSRSEWERNIY